LWLLVVVVAEQLAEVVVALVVIEPQVGLL
jgi:hypothetical protein